MTKISAGSYDFYKPLTKVHQEHWFLSVLKDCKSLTSRTSKIDMGAHNE